MEKKWPLEEIRKLYEMPILDLVFQGASVHRHYHPSREIQVCKLFFIKTGGCSEDCKYCASSSSYSTGIKALPMMKVEEVPEKAKLRLIKDARAFVLELLGEKRGKTANLNTYLK